MQWTKANAPEGLALVMHRPVGGLQELPLETYRGGAHFLLDLVRADGLMFTQVPRSLASDETSLAEVCAEIRQRKDVREIITNARPKFLYALDYSDLYAVIFKQ